MIHPVATTATRAFSSNTTAQVEGNCDNRERQWCILGLTAAYFEAKESKNITRLTEDFATYLGRKDITIWRAVEEFNIEESVVPVGHSLPMSSQHDVPDCVTAGTHDYNWCRKWKKQVRNSSRTSGNSLSSMNAARDSDPSCPPSVATNMTTQKANKADFEISWQRTGTKHREASYSLLSSENNEVKPVCDLRVFTPATCDKLWLQTSSTTYIHRADCNHKPHFQVDKRQSEDEELKWYNDLTILKSIPLNSLM